MSLTLPDKLAEICNAKRAYLAEAKAKTSWEHMDRAARQAPPPRGFAHALAAARANGCYGLIAEIKKASPSAGLIRPDFDPARFAADYEKGGAACLSVLTDTPYFQGENAYLQAARKACALPVLRKDFMLDVWQVAQARALGADCILIIMAALENAQARALYDVATDYGMDTLIEVHDGAELDRALASIPDKQNSLIGINNRNLKTLKVDLHTTRDLAPRVPKERLVVGESGFQTRADLDAAFAQAGVSCFLIGESLMRQQDLTAATRALVQTPAPSRFEAYTCGPMK